MTPEERFRDTKTVAKCPRFTLVVAGESARVTRFDTTDGGETHFELADVDANRDVYPTDRGYVHDGEVYMRRQDWDGLNEKWVNTTWVHVGDLEEARYCVGDSVSAELARMKKTG